MEGESPTGFFAFEGRVVIVKTEKEASLWVKHPLEGLKRKPGNGLARLRKLKEIEMADLDSLEFGELRVVSEGAQIGGDSSFMVISG